VENDHGRSLLFCFQSRRDEDIGSGAVVSFTEEAHPLSSIAIDFLGLLDANIQLVGLVRGLAELEEPGPVQVLARQVPAGLLGNGFTVRGKQQGAQAKIGNGQVRLQFSNQHAPFSGRECWSIHHDE
jgi:hypothetical protein